MKIKNTQTDESFIYTHLVITVVHMIESGNTQKGIWINHDNYNKNERICVVNL